MPFRCSARCVVAATATLLALPVLARSDHHRRHYHVDALPLGGERYAGAPRGGASMPAPQAYGGYYGAAGWEARVNARLTAQAYREPGVTLELAPDAKQTATGGPSGGVPGFSGY